MLAFNRHVLHSLHITGFLAHWTIAFEVADYTYCLPNNSCGRLKSNLSWFVQDCWPAVFHSLSTSSRWKLLYLLQLTSSLVWACGVSVSNLCSLQVHVCSQLPPRYSNVQLLWATWNPQCPGPSAGWGAMVACFCFPIIQVRSLLHLALCLFDGWLFCSSLQNQLTISSVFVYLPPTAPL